MFFHPPLQTGTLIQRYKRFLADVKLADGSILTVHCPNTGSMRSCSAPGSPVAFSRSMNAGRKYAHTLEMVCDQGTWIGVNTSRTNSLVVEAIETGRISEFQEADSIRREVTASKGSRLDLAVSHGGRTTYVEIKNCSLVEDGCAMFPDAITARGTKHLQELMAIAALGMGACVLFLVQRLDAVRFAPAEQIDPLYSSTLREAYRRGVNVLAYQAAVSPEGIEVVRGLPCLFDFP